jgi:hypothetical protein
MPYEANPGGIEGVNDDWPGGSSNLGEVLNPEPPGLDTTYSTKDLEGVPRVDVVLRIICEECGEAFETQALLNVHVRSVHRPPQRRRRAS